MFGWEFPPHILGGLGTASYGLTKGLAENGNMDAVCEQALSQIENRQYDSKLKEDGMRKIIKYGIACYKKDCRVILMKKDTP